MHIEFGFNPELTKEKLSIFVFIAASIEIGMRYFKSIFAKILLWIWCSIFLFLFGLLGLEGTADFGVIDALSFGWIAVDYGLQFFLYRH